MYQGNNSNNNMFQSASFQNNQNGTNMNQNNNNLNIQNNNINMAQSQQIPMNPNQKKFQIHLTNDEQILFTKIYNMLDSNNTGRILGKQAANFMKKSNLNKDVLKNIWLMAAKTSNSFMLQDEFYAALRLIALAQNNMPYSEEIIGMNNPIPPLPVFDLNQNNNQNQFNNYNNNQGNNTNNINSTNNNNNNPNINEMSEKEKMFFLQLFQKHKEPNVERIKAHNAILIWNDNKAEEVAIKTVANLMTPLENKGFFNLREFQVACHLIAMSKKTQLPQRLPDSLCNYLGRNTNNINIFNNNAISRTSSNVSQLFSMNNMNDKNITIQNRQSSNISLSNNNNNNSGNNKIQDISKREEELTQKNNILNERINIAKNKIIDLLKEIELIQKNQNSINDELRNIRQEINSLRNNGSSNINLNINNTSNKSNNLLSKKSDNNISDNNNNLINNPLIKKNLENIGKNMRYDSSDLSNQNINNDFTTGNNNDNFGPQGDKNNAYPNLDSNKKPDIMDLMNNMDISNANNNNNMNNGDTNFNNNNLNNGINTFNNNENEQRGNKQDQPKKDLDFNLEDGDNLRFDDKDVANPYEMDDNKNKNEDNGSNVKKNKEEEDDWDF